MIVQRMKVNGRHYLRVTFATGRILMKQRGDSFISVDYVNNKEG
jgi:hypothetical protein